MYITIFYPRPLTTRPGDTLSIAHYFFPSFRALTRNPLIACRKQCASSVHSIYPKMCQTEPSPLTGYNTTVVLFLSFNCISNSTGHSLSRFSSGINVIIGETLAPNCLLICLTPYIICTSTS